MPTKSNQSGHRPEQSEAAVAALEAARQKLSSVDARFRFFGVCSALPGTPAGDDLRNWIHATMGGGWVQKWLGKEIGREPTDSELHDYRLAWIDSMIEQLKPLPKTKKEPA